jgi:hypothetical protein
MADRLSEEIKYETELLRLVWVTAVATAGGAVSFLLGEATALRAGLLGLGLLFILVLVAVGVRQDRTIRRLLRELGEKP